MDDLLNGRGIRMSSRSILTLVAGATLAAGLAIGPVEAQGFGFGRGAAVGENGAAARSRGVVSNGDGFAARRGGFAADGEGNGLARRGGCAQGQTGSGCRGGAVTWRDDGSLSGQSASEFSGDNGAFSGRRSLTRDADGNLTVDRSADASGTNGAYTGSSSRDNDVYQRSGTYTGTDGQNATVEGNYTRGSGGSRSVTCIDASGATVDCP